MATLKCNLRDAVAKYDKRPICNAYVMLDVINEAIREKIKIYYLVYAYNQVMYRIGYKMDDSIHYMHGVEGSDIEIFDTIEELKNKISYSEDVTIVREFQSDNINSVSAFALGPEGIGASLLLKSLEVEKGMMETSLKDNFMLKQYLVSNDDDRFNYNLSEDQINEFNKLIEINSKKNKKLTILVVVLSIFLVGVFLFAIFC